MFVYVSINPIRDGLQLGYLTRKYNLIYSLIHTEIDKNDTNNVNKVEIKVVLVWLAPFYYRDMRTSV